MENDLDLEQGDLVFIREDAPTRFSTSVEAGDVFRILGEGSLGYTRLEAVRSDLAEDFFQTANTGSLSENVRRAEPKVGDIVEVVEDPETRFAGGVAPGDRYEVVKNRGSSFELHSVGDGIEPQFIDVGEPFGDSVRLVDAEEHPLAADEAEKFIEDIPPVEQDLADEVQQEADRFCTAVADAIDEAAEEFEDRTGFDPHAVSAELRGEDISVDIDFTLT